MKLKTTGVIQAVMAVSLMFILYPVLAGAPDSSGSSDFQQALKNQGWYVHQAQDGTLTLRPPQQTIDSSQNIVGKDKGTTEIANQSMDALKRRLESAGWKVSRDDDGSLIFHKPKPTYQETPQALSADLPMGLDGLFENPHWRVEKSADGSLLLFPQESKVNDQSDRAQITTGVLVIAQFELPIDEWTEAKSIAKAWVESIGVKGLAIGKIRKILRVYLISVVQDEAPYALKHQIAIRQSDGHVIVLN
ncbi:MAG: hypothetical protein GWO88_00965 [Planctomycetia bacterium]|nr:hypothetical protein [Planctomycetia bacterium]